METGADKRISKTNITRILMTSQNLVAAILAYKISVSLKSQSMH